MEKKQKMITLEQLETLNKYGIGPSIDELEIFVMYFKQALNVSELDSYLFEYEELKNILKELRPESLVFDEVTDLKRLKWDKFDIVKAESAIKKTSGNAMVAIAKDIGVKVKLSYSSGIFYRAYVSSDNNRYFDITELVRNKVPDNVKYLESYSNCELLCKIFVRGKKHDVRNCIDTFRKIINNIDDDYVLQVYDARGIKEDRITAMLKLKEEKFSMAKTKVVRNISTEDIDKLLDSINSEFRDSNGFYMMTDDFNDGRLMKCDANSFREDAKEIICDSIYSTLDNGEFRYRITSNNTENIKAFIDSNEFNVETYSVLDGGIKVGDKVRITVINNNVVVEEQ